jgi:hypothetical protein
MRDTLRLQERIGSAKASGLPAVFDSRKRASWLAQAKAFDDLFLELGKSRTETGSSLLTKNPLEPRGASEPFSRKGWQTDIVERLAVDEFAAGRRYLTRWAKGRSGLELVINDLDSDLLDEKELTELALARLGITD